MRKTLASYLDDFFPRGNETAFAHRPGLRLVRWSYSRVARTAFQFARELEARAVGKGDRVLIWARQNRIVSPDDAAGAPGNFISILIKIACRACGGCYILII